MFALMCNISFAAIPNDTIVVGDKAYNLEYLTNSPEAIDDFLKKLDNADDDDVVYKLSDTLINVSDGKGISKEYIPSVVYYDESGNTTIYEKYDGDEIIESFYIKDIE